MTYLAWLSRQRLVGIYTGEILKLWKVQTCARNWIPCQLSCLRIFLLELSQIWFRVAWKDWDCWIFHLSWHFTLMESEVCLDRGLQAPSGPSRGERTRSSQFASWPARPSQPPRPIPANKSNESALYWQPLTRNLYPILPPSCIIYWHILQNKWMQTETNKKMRIFLGNLSFQYFSHLHDYYGILQNNFANIVICLDFVSQSMLIFAKVALLSSCWWKWYQRWYPL